jgi:hypothetical protein
MGRQRKLSKTKTDLLVDVAIFIAFLVALDPRLTGIAVHEWLSIAATAAVVVHLLLHWQWIVQVTGRLLRRLPGATRLNYIVNALFFVGLVVVVMSGLIISESALPLFGIQTIHHDIFWRQLHVLSSEALVFVLGLHVALHWKWIARTVDRYVFKPALAPFRGMRPRRRDAGIEVRP